MPFAQCHFHSMVPEGPWPSRGVQLYFQVFYTRTIRCSRDKRAKRKTVVILHGLTVNR
jgi:hypothetical protein